MFFQKEELADRASFKKALADNLTANYTDSEMPNDELAVKIGRHTETVRKLILEAVDELPDYVFPISEDDMPMLWMETSDAFDMAEDGDFNGIEIVLDELHDWLMAQKR